MANIVHNSKQLGGAHQQAKVMFLTKNNLFAPKILGSSRALDLFHRFQNEANKQKNNKPNIFDGPFILNKRVGQLTVQFERLTVLKTSAADHHLRRHN